MLFRSYQKGDVADVDGLQIYRDGVLVGDVDVPKVEGCRLRVSLLLFLRDAGRRKGSFVRISFQVLKFRWHLDIIYSLK